MSEFHVIHWTGGYGIEPVETAAEVGPVKRAQLASERTAQLHQFIYMDSELLELLATMDTRYKRNDHDLLEFCNLYGEPLSEEEREAVNAVLLQDARVVGYADELGLRITKPEEPEELNESGNWYNRGILGFAGGFAPFRRRRPVKEVVLGNTLGLGRAGNRIRRLARNKARRKLRGGRK